MFRGAEQGSWVGGGEGLLITVTVVYHGYNGALGVGMFVVYGEGGGGGCWWQS